VSGCQSLYRFGNSQRRAFTSRAGRRLKYDQKPQGPQQNAIDSKQLDDLKGHTKMKKVILLGLAAALAMIGAAKADPVPLSTYADANGFIDVQTLTCGQLANTYQEDANALTSWYSGWYNGLAHKHFADFKKGREVEHQVIEYCKAHPDERIIHAIGLMIKEDRAEGMMQEK
jgi:HdeA/HdeB family